MTATTPKYPLGPPKGEERSRRRRPHSHLRALPDDGAASEFADLDPSHTPRADDDPVEWRIHDRTHLEFTIDYAVSPRPRVHTWEAYFFVPESFRLHEASYSKKAIYDDQQSYVRLAVPDIPFAQLGTDAEGSVLARLHASLQACGRKEQGAPECAAATRALRIFACLVRASGHAAMRDVERSMAKLGEAPVAEGAPERPTATLEFDVLKRQVGGFLVSCASVARVFRAALAEAGRAGVPEDLTYAMRWTDEAVSLALEGVCADIAVALEAHAGIDAALPDLAECVASRAVAEARHRATKGYDSVGFADASERQIEHLEFRRHVLKRFTASVLWLTLEVREGAAWIVHVLYAIAAGFAMAFAVLASFRMAPASDSFFRYAILVVLAYAVKDRMKAFLQGALANWASKRFPDRRWNIRDRERQRDLGHVRERAGFVPFRRLPNDVLEMRRLTREHSLEEQARPEGVIWHQKRVEVASKPLSDDPSDSTMLTEIFRLNVGHWLAHTDDPSRKIVFADPSDANIYSATARRVYNINVVYRLTGDEAPSAWHRIRIVVSRKGILRIDPVR